jgi:Mrp family chromosome partitioning ATPase/uncharacterized protein involved in exopolysaccharide biosynthesis
MEGSLMDTTRALTGGEPMMFEEPAAPQAGANPLMVVHLLLQGRYWLALLLAAAGIVIGAVLGYKLPKRTYSSTGMIHIKPVVTPLIFGQGGTMPAYESFVNSQITLMKSERAIDMALASDTWRDHNRGNSPEATEAFKGNLNVWRDSEVIRVSFSDVDPAVAVDGVRAVIDAYNKLYLESDTQSSQHQLKQLEALRDNYQQRLKGLDEQIGTITNSAGADATKAKYQFKTAEMNTAESFWRQSKRRLDEWLQLHPEFAARLATGGAATQPGGAAASQPSAAVAEPALAVGPVTTPAAEERLTAEQIGERDGRMRAMLDDRDMRQSRINDMMQTFGPNHAQVVAEQRALRLVQGQIDRYAATWKPPVAARSTGPAGVPAGLSDLATYEQLRVQELSDRQQLEQVQAEARLLGKQVAQVHAIEMDVDEIKGWRETAKLKIEQLTVESAQMGRVSIPSNGDRPVLRDKRVQIAGASAFGGAVLGVGVVLLLGFTDRRLRTIDQARMSLKQGMRVLGMLPSLPRNLEDPGAASFAALCVHHIRMLLQVMPRLNAHPALAVTSPSPGDGKTSLTLALALSFAASGKSTLLIDCDIVGAGLTRRVNAIIRRRVGQILIRENLITPAQLREALSKAQRTGRKLGEVLVDEGFVEQEQLTAALAMQAETSVGLLDVMRGEVLEECVADTGMARLWILPVGSALAEHGATISPEGFRAVLEQARKRFDVILVDTGPVPGSIESSVAASQVDGVVLTVSRGEQGPLVRRASDHLTDIGARPLGIVFNRATPEDFSSSYGSMSSPSIPARVAAQAETGMAQFGPVAAAVAGNQMKPAKN